MCPLNVPIATKHFPSTNLVLVVTSFWSIGILIRLLGVFPTWNESMRPVPKLLKSFSDRPLLQMGAGKPQLNTYECAG